MGAMEQESAKVCSWPREKVQRDLGPDGGYGAGHLAPGADGGHQASSGTGWGDWYLQDRYHRQLPQDSQYRNTCKTIDHS